MLKILTLNFDGGCKVLYVDVQQFSSTYAGAAYPIQY
jgi:hypothetical protein